MPRQLFFFGIFKPWKFQIVSSLIFPLCNKNLNSFLTEVRKLLKGGKYSREETIWGNTVYSFSSRLKISPVLIGTAPENQQRNRGPRTFFILQTLHRHGSLGDLCRIFYCYGFVLQYSDYYMADRLRKRVISLCKFPFFFADIFLLFWEMICYHFCTFVLTTIEPLMMKFEFFNFQQLLLRGHFYIT